MTKKKYQTKNRSRHLKKPIAGQSNIGGKQCQARKSSQSRQAQAAKFKDIESFEQYRFILGEIAKGKEHCGLPVPIAGEKLILEPRHPVAHVINAHIKDDEALPEGVKLINTFYSKRFGCQIIIWSEPDGRIEWGKVIHNKITHEFSTMACSVAWSVAAEAKAMRTLSDMIPDHLFNMYFLSGMFLETSKRSGVTYVFRKLRPTLALRPGKGGSSMRVLAALCLHPIGYYAESWAGAMCPTDDVMAHLLLMRADEPMYWRRANQISPHLPNAGL